MAAPRGLSPDDIETLRAGLGGGRRPKVVFTSAAGQMAGQTGQVVALGEPADSDEWISVRFGKDKLEFAPTDLQLPGKAPTRRPKPAPAPEPAAPAPTPTPSAATPAAATPAPAPTPPAPRSAPTAPARTEPSAPVVKSAARRARPKGPADLAVTLAWSEGDWSVSASRGSKQIAKPAPVRAADALRMVEMLDSEPVADAVAEIVNTARAEAADRAEQLRRELAEVEARLADLPELA